MSNPSAPEVSPATEPALGWGGLFSDFPYGIALFDADGVLLHLNRRADELLSVDRGAEATCCELICDHVRLSGHDCLTREAVAAGRELPEVRIDVGANGSRRAAWVTASSLELGETSVVFQLRPASADERRSRPEPAAIEPSFLRISALGPLRVEAGGASLTGRWLDQRPGQLLKYLICERGRTVTSEEIAESLWPGAAQDEALTSVRHYVYQLRQQLEPERAPRMLSSFVITHRGGYALARVWIDADEFSNRVRDGIAAWGRGDQTGARRHLEAAARLYAGDFLADDPYAEWAVAERDRLRELASRALRILVELELGQGELEQAADHARAAADLDPLDVDLQRQLLTICLRLGRRGEAMRRYALLRNQLRRWFGEDLDFTLAELVERDGVESLI